MPHLATRVIQTSTNRRMVPTGHVGDQPTYFDVKHMFDGLNSSQCGHASITATQDEHSLTPSPSALNAETSSRRGNSNGGGCSTASRRPTKAPSIACLRTHSHRFKLLKWRFRCDDLTLSHTFNSQRLPQVRLEQHSRSDQQHCGDGDFDPLCSSIFQQLSSIHHFSDEHSLRADASLATLELREEQEPTVGDIPHPSRSQCKRQQRILKWSPKFPRDPGGLVRTPSRSWQAL